MFNPFISSLVTWGSCICINTIAVLGINYNAGMVGITYPKFSDLPFPSAEQFSKQVKDKFEKDAKDFLGYAVPVVITALFIRSSLK